LHENDVRIDSQDLVSKVVFKTVHDCKNNDQCSNPEKDSGYGYKRDDGDKNLFSLGPEISQTDKKFIRHFDFNLPWLSAKGRG
jgi:hypothetical protein